MLPTSRGRPALKRSSWRREKFANRDCHQIRGFERFTPRQGDLRCELWVYCFAHHRDPGGPQRIRRNTDRDQLRLLVRNWRLYHAGRHVLRLRNATQAASDLPTPTMRCSSPPFRADLHAACLVVEASLKTFQLAP